MRHSEKVKITIFVFSSLAIIKKLKMNIIKIKHGRILFLLIIAILAFFFWISSGFHEAVTQTLSFSKAYIELSPVLGVFVFLALAAISAILIFFSSILIVPIAVFAWGEFATFLLLLLGWFIGAMIAYMVGKNLGRKVVEYFVSTKKIDDYGNLISKEMGIFDVVFLKLALPSEVPSFFLGIVRYPFLKYIFVVIISELPFAIWAVYLGDAFVDDNRVLFFGTLIAGFAFLSIAAREYRKKH